MSNKSTLHHACLFQLFRRLSVCLPTTEKGTDTDTKTERNGGTTPGAKQGGQKGREERLDKKSEEIVEER